MNTKMKEYIAELNQNYNELGEDLVMLESILLVSEGDTGFPAEYAASGLERIRDYLCQHTEEIERMAGFLISPAGRRNRSSAPRPWARSSCSRRRCARG